MNAPLPSLLKLKMLHRVRDKSFSPVDPRLFQSLIEQSPRRPYERPSGLIFFIARLLTDKYDP
jgi:hypothetical protein